MQDKVRFIPSEVKLFEGKTPPTTWFNENIIRYFQIKGQKEFVADLIAFLQQTASENLTKTKQTGVPVLEFAYVPEEKGSGEEIANAATYNALQTHVGTQIQYLMKLLTLLKSGLPQAGRELDQATAQVHGVVKDFPHLSQEQSSFLSALMGKLNEMVKKAPLSTQKAFWEKETKMLEKMLKTNTSLITQYKNDIQTLQSKGYSDEPLLAGKQKVLDLLEKFDNSLGKSAVWAVGNGYRSGSLPNQFANTVLNHYMPGQEKYLMQLAELLMFANMGAEFGNVLLNAILGFSAAATQYDFGNFLHGNGKGEFNGSATQARNQLSKETTQAYNDLKKIKEALEKINAEIKKIENDKNLTPSQKKEMISKLKNIKANLQVAQGQLQKLYTLLKQIHIHPGKDGDHFTVTGPDKWQQSLSQDESAVINGNPKEDPPGGLVNIASDIEIFQQTYADQGQNQQMILQMRMTEIQQEWTVVSTAMQQLNQMYMTIAQNISK